MARVTPPSERAAGVRARMVFWFTGRALGRLAGRPAHPDRSSSRFGSTPTFPGCCAARPNTADLRDHLLW